MSTIVSNPYEFTVLNSCSFDHYYSNNSELKIESYLSNQAIYKLTIPEDVCLLKIFTGNFIPTNYIQYIKVTPGEVYYIVSYMEYNDNGYINLYITDKQNSYKQWLNFEFGSYNTRESLNQKPLDPAECIEVIRSLNITPDIYDEVTSTTQSLATE